MSDVILNKLEHLEGSVVALSKTVQDQGRSLSRVEQKVGKIEQKVFDGLEDKIDNMNENIVRDREINEAAHTELKRTLNAIVKFGATSSILIFIVLLSILGSLWIYNAEPMGVPLSASIIVPDTTSP